MRNCHPSSMIPGRQEKYCEKLTNVFFQCLLCSTSCHSLIGATVSAHKKTTYIKYLYNCSWKCEDLRNARGLEAEQHPVEHVSDYILLPIRRFRSSQQYRSQIATAKYMANYTYYFMGHSTDHDDLCEEL